LSASPNILIVHTEHFMNAARLALAFQAAECRVHVLSRRSHPVRRWRLSFIEKSFDYHPLAPLRAFRVAIATVAPDLIIACDDWAVHLLNRLYREEMRRPGAPSAVADAIARSLGRPDSYNLLLVRSRLAEIAAAADVSIPLTAVVENIQQLEGWLRAQGFPAVVKRDYSYAGAGVDIVHDMAQARHGFRRMLGWRNLVRLVKRMVVDFDTEWMFDLLWRTPTAVSVQAYVSGTPANCAVACWNGEVLAGICVEAATTNGPTGRGTVLRVVDNREMLDATERIVRTFGLSGFCGVDFVLERDSGRARLIEINPRATQINHLALGAGRDLVAALRARIAGAPIRERAIVTDRELIVVFPRPSGGERLLPLPAGAYYDVPPLPEAVLANGAKLRRFLHRPISSTTRC
jgi:hypothetical protein